MAALIFYIIPFALSAWLVGLFVSQEMFHLNELGRFQGKLSSLQQLRVAIENLLAKLGHERAVDNRDRSDLEVEKEIKRRLAEAGLESAAERGSFVLLKITSYIAGPAVGAISYLYLIPYYASLLTISLSIVGLIFPTIWLKAKTKNRDEDIQRELPLLIDLTNLGVSAGWDISVALEKAIDILADKFPGHPLMKEFKKARLLASSGYTWDESLSRVSNALKNDAVRRCTLSLCQALKQGGDRTAQLDGIASDAQRIYYAELDKRLAGLPVKAVIVTMVLMLSYLMIVLAPAAVQIRGTVINMAAKKSVSK